MKLTYLGHACFLLKNREGKALMMDPFDAGVGYPVPRGTVDVVTTSHGHHDHNDVSGLTPGFLLVDGPGECTAFGFSITGIETFHDGEGGAKRGGNIVYVIEADGVRVAHLGDLGHIPSSAQYDLIGRADVLLIPVGGYYTIDTTQALKIAGHIDAKLTVPMHYKTPLVGLPISTEEAFAQETRAAYWPAREIDISEDALKACPGTIVLPYPA